MPLSDAAIKNYLQAHDIETLNSQGVLYALDVWTNDGDTNCRWVLVSGFTRRDILTWLGY